MKKPIFYAVVRTRSHLARGYFEILEATTEIETAKRALRDAERAETRELDALVLVA